MISDLNKDTQKKYYKIWLQCFNTARALILFIEKVLAYNDKSELHRIDFLNEMDKQLIYNNEKKADNFWKKRILKFKIDGE